MTVIRPNSVSGINSITAQADEIKVFKSNGTQGGLIIGGANLNATTGISTLLALNVTGNVSIAGTLTYQDVTNVDSIGIITARAGVNVSAGQLDVGSNIKLGNAGVITATSFVGSGANLTGITAGLSNIVEDTSPQLGGNLDTNSKNIVFGDSSGTTVNRLTFGGQADMKLFHDGTNSVVSNATGDLYVNNNADIIIKPANDLFLKPQDGEDGIKVIGNGAVELYHDNVKALSTSSTGINVWGRSGNGILDIYPTGSAVYSILNLHNTAGGTAYNAQLIATSGQSVYLGSGNTGDVVLRTGNSQNKVVGKHNGATELYHSSSKKLETSSSGATCTGTFSTSALHTTASQGAVSIGGGGDIRLANGSWTGDHAGKIQHANNFLYFQGGTGAYAFIFRDPGGANRLYIDENGHVLPSDDNSYDLGNSTKRWRNLYTTDLQLSNKGSQNDVDGTWGNYTIQEGENDLFLINNRSGKKYKFNLTEVS